MHLQLNHVYEVQVTMRHKRQGNRTAVTTVLPAPDATRSVHTRVSRHLWERGPSYSEDANSAICLRSMMKFSHLASPVSCRSRAPSLFL